MVLHRRGWWVTVLEKGAFYCMLGVERGVGRRGETALCAVQLGVVKLTGSSINSWLV